MRVRWLTGFLDTPSRAAEPFWLAVTATTLSPRRDEGVFATLLPPAGDPYLRVQVIGAAPPRTHLDFHVDDVPAAAAEVLGLGASVVADHGGLVVLRSPAGIEFCLVGWQGEAVRPRAVTWPGGQSSLVDQVCLDIPEERYEAESAFWVAVTDWPRHAADLAEFGYLERPAGMPLRLLLQRIGSGPAGVHLDFACDDVDAEVARQVSAGAQLVRRVPGDWTTLRDPVGREYCVTARSPF